MYHLTNKNHERMEREDWDADTFLIPTLFMWKNKN